MKVIDLSHTIYPDMPLYPGTERPIVNQTATCEKDGYCHAYLTIGNHTGTHIDAPMHMVEGAPGLEDFDVSQYCGKAALIDLTEMRTELITKEMLVKFEEVISEVDFLLLKTGWDKFWGREAYYDAFPVPDDHAADYLTSFHLKGIGIDSSSVDPIDSINYSVHKILFHKGMIIIENLTHLDSLPQDIFQFYCLPIPYRNADGSPVRAIAVIDR
jgi:arylformamidase